uniref:Uncharacterized protein n=1 Tax=Arion vulgaris TaxID=1028688 RepID=A0A0B7AIN9_9EUPU
MSNRSALLQIPKAQISNIIVMEIYLIQFQHTVLTEKKMQYYIVLYGCEAFETSLYQILVNVSFFSGYSILKPKWLFLISVCKFGALCKAAESFEEKLWDRFEGKRDKCKLRSFRSKTLAN